MDFLASIEPYVATPAFAAFILGFGVPSLYTWLTGLGVVIPSSWKVWFNAGLCAVVSLIPLGVTWSVGGLPAPEDFFTSLTAAFMASSVWYESLKDRAA